MTVYWFVVKIFHSVSQIQPDDGTRDRICITKAINLDDNSWNDQNKQAYIHVEHKRVQKTPCNICCWKFYFSWNSIKAG